MSKNEQAQNNTFVDDQLRKMGRRELVEFVYALQQNEAHLTWQIQQLKAELDDRALKMTNAGSIAEASLALTSIFEEAQRAVDQYVLSVQGSDSAAQKRAEEIERKAADLRAQTILTQATERATQVAIEAQATAETILVEAQRKATALINEAEIVAQDIIVNASNYALDQEKYAALATSSEASEVDDAAELGESGAQAEKPFRIRRLRKFR